MSSASGSAAWRAMLLPPLIHYLRVWDAGASSRVDRYIAISHSGRRADQEVLSPRGRDHLPAGRLPTRFRRRGRARRLLPDRLGRLTPYKRIDLIVDAFRELGLPVKIVGDGRDRRAPGPRHAATSSSSGWVDDDTLRESVRQLPGATCSPAKRTSASRRSRPGGRPAGDRLRGRRRARHGDRRRDRCPLRAADAAGDLAAAVRRFESDVVRSRPDSAARRAVQRRRSSASRFTRFVERAYQEWRATGQDPSADPGLVWRSTHPGCVLVLSRSLGA